MSLKVVFISLVVLAFLPGFSQEIDEFDFEYTKEISYGINFNSRGGLIGGGNLKFSYLHRNRLYKTFGFEIVNVKHPKEIKVRNAQNESSFILHKVNHFLPIRMNVGIDYVLFKKAPDQGVQVSAVFSGGPSLGLLKPYYIVYNNEVAIPYDPEKHSYDRITRSAGFFYDLGSASFVPGFHLKMGLSFEFGRIRDDVMGVEFGLMYDTYIKEVEIITNQYDFNRSTFPSIYVVLYYGSRK